MRSFFILHGMIFSNVAPGSDSCNGFRALRYIGNISKILRMTSRLGRMIVSLLYIYPFHSESVNFMVGIMNAELRQQNQMALTNISRAASDASTVTLTMPGSSLGKRKNSNLASIATVVSDVQADRYTRPKLNDKPPGLFRVVQDPNVHDESGTNKYLLPIIVVGGMVWTR